ncbi:MAG: hypothetical protein LBI26_03225 [Holosporales bacterium]|jgi:4-diphosphocytidyl-2-C-methyl-D-erythritol kinase|nr:hypothetical protein [Holosporales bacterium]
MTLIVNHASAKVNLMLHITGRSGKYHTIQSIFTFIDTLFDTLYFDTSLEFSEKLDSAYISGIPTEKNLIHRSYHFLKEVSPKCKIPHVFVKKKIPEMAGCGGGSSDAACFINTVLDLWKTKVEKKIEIARNAHLLGMDIPVFLYRYIFKKDFILLNGVGKFDEISEFCEISNNIKNILVVFAPELKISTKEVFSTYRLNRTSFDHPQENCFENSKNSLQASAIKIEPKIQNVLNDIEKTGAIITRMSGSGSTCFGIYKTDTDMQNAAMILSQRYIVYGNPIPKMKKLI